MSASLDSLDFAQIRDIVLRVEAFGGELSPQALAARQACQDVAYGIFALTDFGRAAASLDLYSERIVMDLDGQRFDRAGRIARSRGREANTARRTRHAISNSVFRMVDERTAYALSLVVIYHEDDCTRDGVPPLAVADCADRFELEADGRWRVTYRCLKTVAGAAH